ncbi:MAG: polysaccharide biosynthesis protein [Bacillota bacterium]|nr:polysaccharide biosynthesis protein [Bacillota bacterium]
MKNDKYIVVYDAILITASLIFAFMLKFDFNFAKEYKYFFLLSVIPVIIIMIAFNYVFGLYNNVWKYASIEELFSIIYSVSTSNIVFVLYSYIVNYKFLKSSFYRFPFTVHIIFWILCILTLGGSRFLFRIADERGNKVKSDKVSKNLLIIGAGDAAAMLIKELKKHRDLNYNIKGLIDDDKTKKLKRVGGIKVLGNRDDIKKIAEELKINEIIIAIPSVDDDESKEIINICKTTNCKLKIIPGIYEIVAGKVNISQIRDVSIDDLLGRAEVRLNTSKIKGYIENQTVLVTGGGGSIGSELCRQIAKFNPALLIIVDIYENNVYELQMELNYKFPDLNKKIIIASIRDEFKMDIIFNSLRPDVVFHAAAHKHVPLMEENPEEAIKNNIIGTYNLLRLCDKYSVKKFVQISTDKAVNPTNVMGATKRFCEIMVQGFDRISKTEYVAVRFGNVLGSNGSVIPLFKEQIKRGGPVTVTHPEINRFFMTIPEASQLVIQAGGMAKGGEVFVLDMGEPVKIADLAKDLIKLSGFEPNKDIKIEYTGLRPGEKLYEELLTSELALTTTEHNKIFIEKPDEFNMDYINGAIEEFRTVSHQDKPSIIKMLKKYVPTFHHNVEESD